MARIRSIKPEHWGDKFLPNISLGAHLLWIGTWNFSDDKGIIERDCHLIRSNIFPRRRDIKELQVEKWVEELIKYHFVIPFEYNGFQYLIQRTFDVHQRIDKPQKSKIPDTEILRVFQEHSKNGTGTFKEHSTIIRPQDRIGEDKDRNRKGMGEERSDSFVQGMYKVFKNHNPKYPHDKELDFSACLQIAYKIAESKEWKDISSKSHEILKAWEKIVLFTRTDSWYSGRSLSDLNKQWQTLIQTMSGKKIDKPVNKAFIEVPDGIDYNKLKIK